LRTAAAGSDLHHLIAMSLLIPSRLAPAAVKRLVRTVDREPRMVQARMSARAIIFHLRAFRRWRSGLPKR
jgi:hypothetical protein